MSFDTKMTAVFSALMVFIGANLFCAFADPVRDAKVEAEWIVMVHEGQQRRIEEERNLRFIERVYEQRLAIAKALAK
jgi:hypothetical protein